MMKRVMKLVLLILICLTQAGCLGPIVQLIALPFELAGKVLDVASKVPIPPGVF